MKKLLTILSILMLSYGCQNQTSTTSNPNQVGTIEADDSKSTAARDFSNAYTSNDLLSAKSLFTEDAVFKINDAEMSFDDMASGFTLGHNFSITLEMMISTFILCITTKVIMQERHLLICGMYGKALEKIMAKS